MCPLLVQLQFVTICNTLCMAAALAAQRSTCPRPRFYHPTAGAFVQLLSSAPTVDCVPPVPHLEHLQPVRVGVVHTFRQQDTLHGVAALYGAQAARAATHRATQSNTRVTQCACTASLCNSCSTGTATCALHHPPRTQTRHTPQAAAARLLQLALAPAHAAPPR